MKFYVIRNGQTDWSKYNFIHGIVNKGLNKKGIAEANNIKEKLNEKDIDIIFTSPLKRAKETTDIINKKLNKKVIIDDRLLERDYGEFEGSKKDEFDYDKFWNFYQNMEYEKAEYIIDFYNRISDFIEEVTVDFKGQNILIVTHTGVCKAINFYYGNKETLNGKLGPYIPKYSEIKEYEIIE